MGAILQALLHDVPEELASERLVLKATRAGRGAETNAACAEVKMARTPELPALTAAGARNVTGEFVAWYLANPPA